MQGNPIEHIKALTNEIRNLKMCLSDSRRRHIAAIHREREWLNRATTIMEALKAVEWEATQLEGAPNVFFESCRICDVHKGYTHDADCAWAKAQDALLSIYKKRKDMSEKCQHLDPKTQLLCDELGDLRILLEREGYRKCDIEACNCGSYHKGPSK